MVAKTGRIRAVTAREKLKTRRAHLAGLYLAGKPFRLIAQEYGGTELGVRSTVRKLRERGVLPDRPQPNWREWA